MDYLLYSILPIIGGIIWYALWAEAVKAPGQELNKKFVSLGTLPGKTYNQIAAVAGPANAVSAMANGQVLRQ